MSNSRELDSILRHLCHTIIAEHVEYEKDLFDFIWDHFWRIYSSSPAKRDLKDFSRNLDSEKLQYLGAISSGSGGFDSLQIIALLATVTARLEGLRKKIDLDIAKVSEVLNEEVSSLGLTLKVTGIVQEYAVPMLAEMFGVSSNNVSLSQFDDNLLLVDWSCVRMDYTIYDVISSRQRFDVTVVEKRFRNNKNNYTIFVDETVPIITIEDSSNLWDKFTPSQRVLFGMILSCLENRRPLSFLEICEKALARECNGRLLVDDQSAARKCMYGLNKVTSKIFNDVIKPLRGFNKYESKGNLSYCWIRVADGTSRLDRF